MKPYTRLSDNAVPTEAQSNEIKELEGVGRAVLVVGGVALLFVLALTPFYISFWKRVVADADAYRIRVIQCAERGCK